MSSCISSTPRNHHAALILLWRLLRDICWHSFEKRAKGGSFRLHWRKVTDHLPGLLWKGWKWRQLGRKAHRLGTDRHPFISTGRNKTQPYNIAFLLPVRELFKLQARLQNSFKCSWNKNEIVFFFSRKQNAKGQGDMFVFNNKILFKQKVQNFFSFYFCKNLGRSGDGKRNILLGWTKWFKKSTGMSW